MLSHTELAVLCVLKNCREMTQSEMSNAVPGALELLAGLSDSGYIECRRIAQDPARWRVTDKGVELVIGDP